MLSQHTKSLFVGLAVTAVLAYQLSRAADHLTALFCAAVLAGVALVRGAGIRPSREGPAPRPIPPHTVVSCPEESCRSAGA